MMKPGLMALALVITAGSAFAQEVKDLAGAGKALIQEFGGTLKAELVAGMKAGGPVKAIEICKSRAPEIARAVSDNSDGWTVSRSSHRLRNPDNAPDAYTASAIKDFLARQEAGESAVDLVRAEIIEEDGQKVFRMVKAIPTATVCLACHGGDEVSPEVDKALATAYPEDKARGFSEGEMRGVFTLRKLLK